MGKFMNPKWSELMYIETNDNALTVAIETYPKEMKYYPGYDLDLSMKSGFFNYLPILPEIQVKRLRINYLHSNLFPMVLYFKQFLQQLKKHFWALLLQLSQLQACISASSGDTEDLAEQEDIMSTGRKFILF